ncbi:protein-tyrosine phosphatase 2 [Blastomyces gilchristii SLH14081]|uniref:Protein-tyrosine phosphatase 2 n=1 Tax=Blastomyces gilchristii (strain SLH14081) TaxID=559298 RepID=A0A179UIR7_BLAGS|nr:protein-tyrosine phosphatase 2 [Blastomyces gilchristii SLH14081]OAT07047.1 protein-tyrosine phosphatase 2 [Blastomyces gilchristii SLH14081]
MHVCSVIPFASCSWFWRFHSIITIQVQPPIFTSTRTRLREWTANLAPQVIVNSSDSCPSPAALDATSPTSTVGSGASASLKAANNPSTLSPNYQSSYSRNNSRHRTPKKIRDLLGQAKSFRRKTAAKMSEAHFQSPLTKRSRSVDSRASGQWASASGEEENGSMSTEDNGDKRGIPAFLHCSGAEIQKKFSEIEMLQAIRLSGIGGPAGGNESRKWVLENRPEILPRNRYVNIKVWSHSRIHLKVPDGECDFINASPISLSHSKTGNPARYIAAQGPKTDYLEHFWSMVLHETGDVAVVIMLTQSYEQGKEKCSPYFPLTMEEPVFHLSRAVAADPFVDRNGNDEVERTFVGKVSLLEYAYDDKCRCEIRKLELKLESQTKIVWHYLFAGWTDYMKPEGKDRDAIVELTKVTAEKAGSLENPRIVHCSAGVGRTGTFITIDHLLREMQTGNLLKTTDDTDPIFDTVNLLREQRIHMVYTEMQYQFLYDILREQAHLFLGRDNNNTNMHDKKVKSPGSRSQKMAKYSSDTPFEPTQKEELVPIIDSIPTPGKR